LISAIKLDQELKNDAPHMILAGREVVKTSDGTIPPEVTPMIDKFSDVFSEDLSNKLPSIRDIQYTINLVP